MLFPILAFTDKTALDDCVNAFVWIDTILVNSFLHFDANTGCSLISDDDCDAGADRWGPGKFVGCRILHLKKIYIGYQSFYDP